ncbi:unnamed protein product [Fraxinus pennsylvanica]|uniref:DUF7894 domain-containing protein n=1 Tax=Fraxinus pennsylvanica TaxID=56036 RepID=A0AAD2A8T6_9LAMI|nr:unnamed protein product [Fraxinus pennsylvanica]
MKVAPKVILLFNDADGLGSALYGALRPNSGSNLQILNNSFELSLERYGVKDREASGQILHFVNANGLYEVSILLLQNYEPPILACALNEVLISLAGADLSTMPTLVVPFIVPESKLKLENRYFVTSEKVSVYGMKLGPTTDVTQGLSSTLQKPSPSMKINHEDLSCLLHLVNVIKVPTLVLIGRSSQRLLRKSYEEELEVIYAIGEHLASISSLSFAKEKMAWKPTETSRDAEEPWRALYG